jgi:hypothetical protein
VRLLSVPDVDYLIVGGYAVGLHGYPRATIALDIWIASTADNADRMVAALRAFGFDVAALAPGLFLDPASIVRLGTPPFRIEVMTTIRWWVTKNAAATLCASTWMAYDRLAIVNTGSARLSV